MGKPKKKMVEELNPSFIKNYFLYGIIFVLLVLLVLTNINFHKDVSFKIYQTETCGDGSFYDTCSLRRPYFCEGGLLVEKASICGCSDNLNKNGDFCTSQYFQNLKTIELDYVLRGKKGNISLGVYGNAVNYLSGLPKSILYSQDE